MKLLKPKELAAVLGRDSKYVYSMHAQGFPMPGGTATIEEARAWLLRHPRPRGASTNGTGRSKAGRK